MTYIQIINTKKCVFFYIFYKYNICMADDFDKEFYKFIGMLNSGLNKSAPLYRKALSYFNYNVGTNIKYDHVAVQELLVDVIGDLYVKVKEGKVASDKHLEAIAYTMLKHKFIDEYRKKKTRKRLDNEIASFGSTGGKKGFADDDDMGMKQTTTKTLKGDEDFENRQIARNAFYKLGIPLIIKCIETS